jgi:hypothetical protein
MVQLYSSDTVLIKTDLPSKLKFEIAFVFGVISPRRPSDSDPDPPSRSAPVLLSWNHWPKNRLNDGMHAQAMPIFPSAIPEAKQLKPTHVLSNCLKLSS